MSTFVFCSPESLLSILLSLLSKSFWELTGDWKECIGKVMLILILVFQVFTMVRSNLGGGSRIPLSCSVAGVLEWVKDDEPLQIFKAPPPRECLSQFWIGGTMLWINKAWLFQPHITYCKVLVRCPVRRILRLYTVCIVLLLISSDEFWLPVWPAFLSSLFSDKWYFLSY